MGAMRKAVERLCADRAMRKARSASIQGNVKPNSNGANRIQVLLHLLIAQVAVADDGLFSKSYAFNCSVRVACVSDDPAARAAADFACVAAEFSATDSAAVLDRSLSIARPATCCGADCAVARGAVALLDRGECSFHQKASLAARAGASAVVVRNLNPGPAIPMGVDPAVTPSSLDIPVVMVSKEAGDAMIARARVLKGEQHHTPCPTAVAASLLLHAELEAGATAGVDTSRGAPRILPPHVELGPVGRFTHNPTIRVHAQLQQLRVQTSVTEHPQRATAPAQSNSFSMFVHAPASCRFISKSLIESGVWEPAISRRILERLQLGLDADGGKTGASKGRGNGPAGLLFVDVGANIGWFSLLAAAQGHEVLALEPMEFNLELLRASAAALEATVAHTGQAQSGRIEITKTALSDAVGQAQRNMCVLPAFAGDQVSNAGNGQLHELTHSNAPNCTDIVRTTTLDDLLQSRVANYNDSANGKQLSHPFVMKLDIEGFETRALRGARYLLSGSAALGGPSARPCLVFAEHWAKYAKWSGVRELELFELMFGHGFEAFTIEADGSQSRQVHASDLAAGRVADGDYEFRLRAEHCPVVPAHLA